MAENTKIQWTDYTFNPWRGCTKVAEGCKFCYAEVNYSVKMHGVKWGRNGTRVKTSSDYWKQPLKWNKWAIDPVASAMREDFPRRPRVFCASLADVFEDWDGPIFDHNGVPIAYHENGAGLHPYKMVLEAVHSSGVRPATMADLRRDLFQLIDATPHLDWLLLTKRPENVRKMWPWGWGTAETFDKAPQQVPTFPHGVLVDKGAPFRPNVWLLTSIATQADADRNIPELLRCRDLSPVLGISAEPLIEAVDLRDSCDDFREYQHEQIALGNKVGQNWPDWLIAGGESGPNARPCDVSWIRSIVQQCKSASVPCFVKQLGANCWYHTESANLGVPQSIRVSPCDPKGGDMSEWPEDLRVREFPKVEAFHA